MRRLTLLVLVAVAGVLGAIWVTAAGAAIPTVATKTVTVTPAKGKRHTTFVVSYKPPSKPVGSSMAPRYSVAVTPPARAGCRSVGGATPTAGSTSARERFKLRPPKHGWCLGTYHGRVELTETPTCGPPITACPMVVAILTVGRFSFRVR